MQFYSDEPTCHAVKAAHGTAAASSNESFGGMRVRQPSETATYSAVVPDSAMAKKTLQLQFLYLLRSLFL